MALLQKLGIWVIRVKRPSDLNNFCPEITIPSVLGIKQAPCCDLTLLNYSWVDQQNPCQPGGCSLCELSHRCGGWRDGPSGKSLNRFRGLVSSLSTWFIGMGTEEQIWLFTIIFYNWIRMLIIKYLEILTLFVSTVESYISRVVSCVPRSHLKRYLYRSMKDKQNFWNSLNQSLSRR